jgi:hypothetical protein
MSFERRWLLALCALPMLGGCAELERGPASEASAPTDGSADAGADAAPGDGPSFAEEIHPILLDTCGRCHGAGGAQFDRFAVYDDAERAYEEVLGQSNPGDPEQSSLLRRASGSGHARVIAAGSPDYMLIAAWMAGGELP